MKEILKKVRALLKNGTLKIVRTTQDERLLIAGEQYCPLHESHSFIRRLFYKEHGIFVEAKKLQSVIDYLDMQPLTVEEPFEMACRVYCNDDYIVYELNKDTKECILVAEDGIGIDIVSDVLFKHSVDFQNQVMPDWKIEIEEIFGLIHKHFNLKNEQQEKMLILYLVTSFIGVNIPFPVLILNGEKGSSKSTTMRKLEKLIDPKTSDMFGLPHGSDGLELRLSNNYYMCLDNLQTLNRRTSDVLARSCTGASISKRRLYSNEAEIVMNIKCLVALNGISLVAKESDLLDRSLILELERINPKEIKSEQELWASFEEDRPKILGCIFHILSIAYFDTKPIKEQEKIRLADFHIACIKVGRVLGMTDKEVSDILWDNQRNVNRQSLNEDIVACCLIELMSHKKEYINSMTGLLVDLQDLASKNGIVGSVLPKTPNHLSNRLRKVKSNLQAEYGIVFNVANVGAFKQITIEKNCKNDRKLRQ